MTYKRLVLLQLAMLAGLVGQARINIGLTYAPFLVNYAARNSNTALFEKTGMPYGQLFGLQFYTALSRSSTLSFGAGISQVRYRKETSGIFPESNAFGITVIDQRNGYWTFPVSFYQTFARRSGAGSYGGLRITYLPAVLGRSDTHISTYAGAVESSYATNYRDDSQAFQHSLLVSFSNQLQLGRNSPTISFDPYLGIGSGYEKRDKMNICTISFGIQIGFRFSVPEISIDTHREPDKEKEKKKQELLKKQKEIEQQLNKQPKTR